jgi:WD40 repeat protein
VDGWGPQAAGDARGARAGGDQPDRVRRGPAGRLGQRDRTVRAWDVSRARLHSVCRVENGALALGRGFHGRLWVAQGTAITALSLPEHTAAARRPRSRAPCPPWSRSDATRRSSAAWRRRRSRCGSATSRSRCGSRARRAASPGTSGPRRRLTLWDEICTLLPRKGLQSAWEEASLEGHADPVLCLAVSGDGGRALSGSMDGTVRLWDLARASCWRPSRAREHGGRGRVLGRRAARDLRQLGTGRCACGTSRPAPSCAR